MRRIRAKELSIEFTVWLTNNDCFWRRTCQRYFVSCFGLLSWLTEEPWHTAPPKYPAGNEHKKIKLNQTAPPTFFIKIKYFFQLLPIINNTGCFNLDFIFKMTSNFVTVKGLVTIFIFLRCYRVVCKQSFCRVNLAVKLVPVESRNVCIYVGQ